MTETRYAIGIDLGTTNCTLSKLDLHDSESVDATVCAVQQIVHPHEIDARNQLPSFLYAPVEEEKGAGAFRLPWSAEPDHIVGTYAQKRGSEVPGRVASSAKSWLSHNGVDRRDSILPYDAADDVEKMSPVEASAHYLRTLRLSWDHSHPEHPLESQDVVVTVPASFDAVARTLTEEAIRMAGLDGSVTLLEEPQAALYAWVAKCGERWRDHLAVGDTILVCDIGGGTTDLSLIEVGETNGNLSLERLAVGDHILLGGDNMDLTLAHVLKAQLEADGKRVEDWQLRAMTHGCRAAKEALFDDQTLESFPVAVPGRGKKLIGGTLKTELHRNQAEEVLLGGFFPEVSVDTAPTRARRVGLTALGLPYAQDAGVTRHLAAFLSKQETAAQTHSFRHPSALLFNGGVTRSAVVRDRIVRIVNQWIQQDGGQEIRVLPDADPDMAVSQGAAYFGRVRQGKGIRIRGGTTKSYYVGIERAELAVPGIPPKVDAICIAPYGMEEGTENVLPLDLGLVVGESASFRFMASGENKDEKVGNVANPTDLEELPPIETILKLNEQESGQLVPVRLQSRVTEVGTLELSALETHGDRRWKLEFNVRTQ
jgi:molecular chaperone DnaK (HSP70)